MGRIFVYAALFPFLMGVPFLGLASTGGFGRYVLFVYTLMIGPALFLAALDFLLRQHVQWQGIACALAGSTSAILSVAIGMGGVGGPVHVALGFMGALAATLCWMAARGVAAMQTKG
ncbi:MAG: hypothetical protein K2Y71_04385 [Xanthobacteraceae bacterium]|nr:hypothetical protein [Xanthobacteraceae bacterium]